ncbi:DNA/RNA non-specific endonuclease [Lysobacter sp. M2-1]|uniref:DNA/RNA non-specific endonuclease n=1 Tax=Lysobacter sp. M2-1 TaxID=2916839 RepID=UPI001F572C66|nr:DNA/RNA non-specific endonuclease [Lysobacter sp. M2-1]
MTFEAFHILPPPIAPYAELPSPLRDLFAQPASEGLSPGLLQADPGEVDFDLDAQSVRITGEHEDQWNTRYTASGEMQLSAPGTGTTTVPVRFDVTLRNENATPAQMRAVNPFDPATIPERTRIEVYGRDYAGTPLEESFRALADANGLASIDDLRLSLEMTEDGELRVMTGSNALFDAPREHGPSSLPGDREDFSRHTVMLADPAGADRAGYSAMLLHGTFLDGTVGTVEDVEGDSIRGTVTESGSGEVNDVIWTLDGEGRPTEAEATLTWEPGSGGRESDRIEANAQSRFRSDNDMKGSGDDVGHIIAYRFVNGHGAVNMFPQESNLNQRVYARMEQEWSDWLANGMEVRIDVDLTPNDVRRPDEVQVDYEVIDPATGNVVYDPSLIVFENRGGQAFDAIAESRMEEMIDTANA